eukprot:1946114-Amphidinium_carterae.4
MVVSPQLSVGVQDDRQNDEMETAEEKEPDIENLQQQVPRIPKRGRPPRELPLTCQSGQRDCPGCEGETSQHTAACLRNKRSSVWISLCIVQSAEKAAKRREVISSLITANEKRKAEAEADIRWQVHDSGIAKGTRGYCNSKCGRYLRVRRRCGRLHIDGGSIEDASRLLEYGSSRQGITAVSSCEAEIRAALDAYLKGSSLRSLLMEWGL